MIRMITMVVLCTLVLAACDDATNRGRPLPDAELVEFDDATVTSKQLEDITRLELFDSNQEIAARLEYGEDLVGVLRYLDADNEGRTRTYNFEEVPNAQLFYDIWKVSVKADRKGPPAELEGLAADEYCSGDINGDNTPAADIIYYGTATPIEDNLDIGFSVSTDLPGNAVRIRPNMAWCWNGESGDGSVLSWSKIPEAIPFVGEWDESTLAFFLAGSETEKVTGNGRPFATDPDEADCMGRSDGGEVVGIPMDVLCTVTWTNRLEEVSFNLFGFTEFDTSLVNLSLYHSSYGRDNMGPEDGTSDGAELDAYRNDRDAGKSDTFSHTYEIGRDGCLRISNVDGYRAEEDQEPLNPIVCAN